MSDPAATRSLLGTAPHLDRVVHAVLVLLVGTSAVRYVLGHGLGDRTPVVLGVAAGLLAVYAAGGRLPRHFLSAWLATAVLSWVGLVLLAPSFAWVAIPLGFAALRVLPFRAAVVVVAGIVAVVVVALARLADRWDPTVVAGPVCVAVLSVMAYRALERDAAARQDLLDDLFRAQGDLAAAQREAGRLAERHRISREIHDSVAQGLSSITLLLEAAQQEWGSRPAAAREHVGQAATTARDGLTEVRRVVRDLAAPALDGTALPDALRRTCTATGQRSGSDAPPLHVRVAVEGAPRPVAPPVETAILRTARGALANVVEHSGASTAVVTLTYLPDAVSLDVRDDGRGFATVPKPALGRGLGLRGIRDRVEALGGELAVESGPGDGTAVAVTLPTHPAHAPASPGPA